MGEGVREQMALWSKLGMNKGDKETSKNKSTLWEIDTGWATVKETWLLLVSVSLHVIHISWEPTRSSTHRVLRGGAMQTLGSKPV